VPTEELDLDDDAWTSRLVDRGVSIEKVFPDGQAGLEGCVVREGGVGHAGLGDIV
jgi:hypothetical protein